MANKKNKNGGRQGQGVRIGLPRFGNFPTRPCINCKQMGHWNGECLPQGQQQARNTNQSNNNDNHNDNNNNKKCEYCEKNGHGLVDCRAAKEQLLRLKGGAKMDGVEETGSSSTIALPPTPAAPLVAQATQQGGFYAPVGWEPGMPIAPVKPGVAIVWHDWTVPLAAGFPKPEPKPLFAPPPPQQTIVIQGGGCVSKSCRGGCGSTSNNSDDEPRKPFKFYETINYYNGQEVNACSLRTNHVRGKGYVKNKSEIPDIFSNKPDYAKAHTDFTVWEQWDEFQLNIPQPFGRFARYRNSFLLGIGFIHAQKLETRLGSDGEMEDVLVRDICGCARCRRLFLPEALAQRTLIDKLKGEIPAVYRFI